MEKADVLELVVKYLKSQLTEPNSSESSTTANQTHAIFRDGMSLCASETMSFLQNFNDMQTFRLVSEVQKRLLNASPVIEGSHWPLQGIAPNKTLSSEEDVTGILLDLSQKTSNAVDVRSQIESNLIRSYIVPKNVASPAAIQAKLPENVTKHEILQKIRSNIFEKRRLRRRMNILRRMPNPDGEQDHDFMWRPW